MSISVGHDDTGYTAIQPLNTSEGAPSSSHLQIVLVQRGPEQPRAEQHELQQLSNAAPLAAAGWHAAAAMPAQQEIACADCDQPQSL